MGLLVRPTPPEAVFSRSTTGACSRATRYRQCTISLRGDHISLVKQIDVFWLLVDRLVQDASRFEKMIGTSTWPATLTAVRPM